MNENNSYRDEDSFHHKVMEKVQREWEDNANHHIMQRYMNEKGIRSSQLSALVKFLIDINVIKEEDL